MILRIVVRRLLFLILVLFGLSLITFALSHIIPADPARLVAGPRASQESVKKIREHYGLDDPLTTQYIRYVRNVATGDLGDSTSTRRSVNQDLRQFLPATIELSVVAFIISVVVGVPLGVLSAIRPNSIFDMIGRLVSITGLAMPSFWLALMLQFLFFAKLGWLPDGQRLPIDVDPPGAITRMYTIDALLHGDFGLFWTVSEHLLLPSLVLAYGSLPSSPAWCAAACWKCSARTTSALPGPKGYANRPSSFGTASRMPCSRRLPSSACKSACFYRVPCWSRLSSLGRASGATPSTP